MSENFSCSSREAEEPKTAFLRLKVGENLVGNALKKSGGNLFMYSSGSRRISFGNVLNAREIFIKITRKRVCSVFIAARPFSAFKLKQRLSESRKPAPGKTPERGAAKVQALPACLGEKWLQNDRKTGLEKTKWYQRNKTVINILLSHYNKGLLMEYTVNIKNTVLSIE